MQKFGGEAGVVGQAMQSIEQAGDFAAYKAAVTESPLVQNFGGESGVVGKAMRSIRQADDFSAYKAAETDSPLVDKFGGPTGVYGKAVRSVSVVFLHCPAQCPSGRRQNNNVVARAGNRRSGPCSIQK